MNDYSEREQHGKEVEPDRHFSKPTLSVRHAAGFGVQLVPYSWYGNGHILLVDPQESCKAEI